MQVFAKDQLEALQPVDRGYKGSAAEPVVVAVNALEVDQILHLEQAEWPLKSGIAGVIYTYLKKLSPEKKFKTYRTTAPEGYAILRIQ